MLPEQPRVRCYDTKNRKIYFVSESEVPGTFIQGDVDGIPGSVWLDPLGLKPNPGYYHESLRDEYKEYILELMENLRGVYDLTYEEWEDGFRKDRNPDNEMAMWLPMSGRLRGILDSEFWDEVEKKELFKMMLAIMNGGSDHAAQNNHYSPRIEDQKLELVKRLTEPDNA
jgi:hypothetical protein